MPSRDEQQSGEGSLFERLARHNEELSDLPGVVGTGVGQVPGGEPVIHIYVMAESDLGRVRGAAERVLSDSRVEVIVMGPPDAQAN